MQERKEKRRKGINRNLVRVGRVELGLESINKVIFQELELLESLPKKYYHYMRAGAMIKRRVYLCRWRPIAPVERRKHRQGLMYALEQRDHVSAPETVTLKDSYDALPIQ